MFLKNTVVHYLSANHTVEFPKKFTYPFQYIPHKLCEIAAIEVQKYLENQSEIKHNFDKLGKMFGVLVVKTSDNKTAYLVAFSGKIDEKTRLNGFVPPIFDTLNPNGFYKKEEQKLNKLTEKIERLENSEEYNRLKNNFIELKSDLEKQLQKLKSDASNAKKKRRKLRDDALRLLSEESFKKISQQLDKESVEHHYRIKDFKKFSNFKIAELEEKLQPLKDLKAKRKELSSNLQKRLHKSYKFLNAKGEFQNLLDIFNENPPAGAGECCAPKLLQFAYQNNLKPMAMAEFWWGKQPVSEVRKHQQFYPACKSKCKPILGFMLQGLTVDENPVKNRKNIELKIVFEDDYLLAIDKPCEFLSVSGNEIKDSVFTRMQKYLPKATGSLLVHRLDMATSGLLLIAKTAQVHKMLQQQFINRTIKKRYVAVLDGLIIEKSGEINLPLRVDYHNRPRQLVCFKSGKPSITRFEVIEQKGNRTKVYLYPKTGRTHQLRVHCAHHLGLNTPILGDDLYGISKDRLYLHAEQLIFKHPVSKREMRLLSETNI